MTSPSIATGSIAGSVLPIRRAEELIATLPGVLSVRIVPSETGAVDEIHVLTTDQVPPKNTVRNIESALMAQLGLRVNHKKISIATTLDAPRALDGATAMAMPTPMGGLSAIPGGLPSAPSGSVPTPSSPAASFAAAFQAAANTPYAAMTAVVPGVAPQVVPPAVPPMAVPPEMAASPVAPPMAPVMPAQPVADAAVTRAPAPAAASAAGPAPAGASHAAPVERRAVAVGVRPEVSGARRLLLFEDVEVRRSRVRGVTCRVTLTRDGVEHFGEAEGQESDKARIELAARATVQAIASALRTSAGGERSLSLEGAKRIDAFDREYVLASLVARIGRETLVLTGTCEIREGVETGAVLAVLDATNRWIHVDR